QARTRVRPVLWSAFPGADDDGVKLSTHRQVGRLMFKRPVALSLLAVLLVALPHQAMRGSVSPAAGRPATWGSQAMSSTKNVSVNVLLEDGFASLPLGMNWADGSRHGNWRDQFGGYGKVGITLDGTHVQASSPKASKSPSETHAALVTS